MTDDQILSLTREAGWNGICSEIIGVDRRKSIFTPTNIEQIRAFVRLVMRTRQTSFSDTKIDNHAP